MHTADTNVNFYRTEYFDELNRKVIEASLNGDKAWLETHLSSQDSNNDQLFFDELFENRIGMQIIQQLLHATQTHFDITDVACGNAMLLRRLQQDGHRIQGIDLSPVRVSKNADINMKAGFCEDLPVENESADIVIALECMEHVYDLDKSLRECFRILRKGGAFLCQVPLENFADGSNHVRLFNAERLQAAVSGIGFQVMNIWQIPYLVGEAPQNLFIMAKRPEGEGAADLIKAAAPIGAF